MRFTLVTLALLAASTFAAPAYEHENIEIPLQLPVLSSSQHTLRFPNPFAGWATKGDDGDICPKMKVSCVKDGKTVGDIGKKPFCRDGVTCGQCHNTENTAECNAKYITECKAQCEAQGPLGGTGNGILAEWFQ